MLLNKPNVEIKPKTAEERFRAILSRPRNPHAQIRLAMTKNTPIREKVDK